MSKLNNILKDKYCCISPFEVNWHETLCWYDGPMIEIFRSKHGFFFGIYTEEEKLDDGFYECTYLLKQVNELEIKAIKEGNITLREIMTGQLFVLTMPLSCDQPMMVYRSCSSQQLPESLLPASGAYLPGVKDGNSKSESEP